MCPKSTHTQEVLQFESENQKVCCYQFWRLRGTNITVLSVIPNRDLVIDLGNSVGIAPCRNYWFSASNPYNLVVVVQACISNSQGVEAGGLEEVQCHLHLGKFEDSLGYLVLKNN